MNTMNKTIIHSDNAPKAVGTYSQAVKIGNTVYLSGQIGLDPASGILAEGFNAQAHQVFQNLRAVATCKILLS
jgi:enamine deaminase RidA (YjgF/YER057c/UK114 family)